MTPYREWSHSVDPRCSLKWTARRYSTQLYRTRLFKTFSFFTPNMKSSHLVPWVSTPQSTRASQTPSRIFWTAYPVNRVSLLWRYWFRALSRSWTSAYRLMCRWGFRRSSGFLRLSSCNRTQLGPSWFQSVLSSVIRRTLSGRHGVSWTWLIVFIRVASCSAHQTHAMNGAFVFFNSRRFPVCFRIS